MYKIISISSGKMSDERTTYGGTGIFFAVDIGLLTQSTMRISYVWESYTIDVNCIHATERGGWGGVGVDGWGGRTRACVCDGELYSFFSL